MSHPLRPRPKDPEIDVEVCRHGRHGATQRRFQGGKGELVDPQRARERVSPQPLEGRGVTEEESGLGAAEQLVTTRRDHRRTGEQRCGCIGLVRQEGVGSQQSTADVDDERDAERRELVDLGGTREALDAKVARVHLEDAAGVGPDGLGVVGDPGAVGRADLSDPGARGGDEVGQPEAVTDLDHLASAHDDLTPCGEGRRGQHEGGRSVVDDERVCGRRHRVTQGGERAPAASSAGPRGRVELDVDVSGRSAQGRQRRLRQGRPPDVGVHDDPGGVDEGPQGRAPLGQGRPRGPDDVARSDLTGPRALLS